ncbi:hypothetical protein [Brevibacillus sp. SYSU BS000544]
MQLSKEDYFFFEWLIVGKGMSQEMFSKLSPVEVAELRAEWKTWFDKQ